MSLSYLAINKHALFFIVKNNVAVVSPGMVKNNVCKTKTLSLSLGMSGVSRPAYEKVKSRKGVLLSLVYYRKYM